MKTDYQTPILLIIPIQNDVITDSNPYAENDFPDPFQDGYVEGVYVEGGITQ